MFLCPRNWREKRGSMHPVRRRTDPTVRPEVVRPCGRHPIRPCLSTGGRLANSTLFLTWRLIYTGTRQGSINRQPNLMQVLCNPVACLCLYTHLIVMYLWTYAIRQRKPTSFPPSLIVASAVRPSTADMPPASCAQESTPAQWGRGNRGEEGWGGRWPEPAEPSGCVLLDTRAVSYKMTACAPPPSPSFPWIVQHRTGS
ncbi:hypothetical protein GQ53DRAFT_399140 [Thozetella sp. PMI_491]|nr:hypothetical protein GQ53DRAFT_399140 [Thozetella sp. PMI_491]